MQKQQLAALLLFGGCLCLAPRISAAVQVSKIEARSGGREIEIDKYIGSRGGRPPAILVLHGAGGVLFDGPEMRRMAIHLAEAGNTAYLIHYFNRTGTLFGLDAGMQKNFSVWLETIRDCITAVQRDHGDSSTIGIYGYSLGAFLAVAAASDNPAVGAVVEQAGGIWNGKTERIHKMSPVLVLHGEADQRVPFPKYALPLVKVLRMRGAIVQTRFFPGEGHGFTQPAMSVVRDAATGFFRQHLRP